MPNETTMIQEPYRGLRPYREEDQEFFFGRDEERDILIDKLFANKLTLLFSATGVGKSSLLQASVMPELKRPDREYLDVAYINEWMGDPFNGIKEATTQALQEKGKISLDFPTNETSNLKKFFQSCSPFASKPLIIILDQFEEFFLYHRSKEDFHSFIKQLSEAILDRTIPIVFLISMREDFALELNAFKRHLPTTLFENYFRLEKLTKQQAEEAILHPIKKIGYTYENDLPQKIINDLYNGPLNLDNTVRWC